jgi:Fe-S-cluster-containing dehydrogenase component
MLIALTIQIPDGDKCGGCRYLQYQEQACEYKCVLFNDWNLDRWSMPVNAQALAYKCEDCLSHHI